MVKPITKTTKEVDLSFMPSLQCDLSCAHCMYNSSPTNTLGLDLDQTKWFVSTVDWDKINACGFYGGEPGIKLDLYSQYIELVPEAKPKFTITDGTWSRTEGRTRKFVEWALRYKLQVFVSSTQYHTPHQNLERLQDTCREHGFVIKGDDTSIPMGRLATADWTCGFKCRGFTGPIRFAVMPPGNIIFQSCDGVYPVVGTYHRPFQEILDFHGDIVLRCQRLRGMH